jgi:hypothetical protein
VISPTHCNPLHRRFFTNKKIYIFFYTFRMRTLSGSHTKLASLNAIVCTKKTFFVMALFKFRLKIKCTATLRISVRRGRLIFFPSLRRSAALIYYIFFRALCLRRAAYKKKWCRRVRKATSDRGGAFFYPLACVSPP